MGFIRWLFLLPKRYVRQLSLLAVIGMFLILATGSTVTNTGSAEGCGKSWPLCHGEFIPAYAFETLVEFTHRITTASISVLIILTAIGAWRSRGSRRETKVLVGMMVGSLFAQAGLGAAAVMWPQTAALLAIHFGVSLACFAATFLLWRIVNEAPDQSPRDLPAVPRGYRRLAWGTLLASLVATYVGAYMRHSGNELGCYTWPSCNGELIPDITGSAGVAFLHRLTALVVASLIAWLWLWSRQLRAERPGLVPMANAALVLVIAQSLMGGAVVLTELKLWSTLGHAAVMALMFVCLADLCRQSLPPRRARTTAPTIAPSLSPAD